MLKMMKMQDGKKGKRKMSPECEVERERDIETVTKMAFTHFHKDTHRHTK